MNSRFVYASLFILLILGNHVIQTNGLFFGLIGMALAAKALIISKLVAGASLIGQYYRTFSDRPDRYKRDLANGTIAFDITDLERLFSFVASNDDQYCFPRIICEIHSRKDVKRGEIETGIIEIFKHFNTTVKPSPAAALYRQAAILGSVTSQDVCFKVYDTCKLRREDLINVIQAANQLDK